MVLGGRDRRLNVLVDVKGIDKANAQLKQTENIGNKAAGGIGKSFQSIGPIVRQLGPIIAGAFAVGAITGFIKEVTAIGVAAAETRSLIVASFGDMQREIEAWSSTSVAALTRTKLEVQETAAVFFNILQGMKLNRDAAFDLSTQYVDLISDLASFNRALVTQEEVLIKVRAASTGEFEGLKQLGIVINEQIIKEQAYADGLAEVGDQLDQATKAQAIFNAIVERAGPALGDTVRTLESAAGQAAVYRKEIQELKEEIGEGLLPVQTEWLRLQRELLSFFRDDFIPALDVTSDEVDSFLQRFALGARLLVNDLAQIKNFVASEFGLGGFSPTGEAGTTTFFTTPGARELAGIEARLGGTPFLDFITKDIPSPIAKPLLPGPKGTDADPVVVKVKGLPVIPTGEGPAAVMARLFGLGKEGFPGAFAAGQQLRGGGFFDRLLAPGLPSDFGFRQELQDIQIREAFAGVVEARREFLGIPLTPSEKFGRLGGVPGRPGRMTPAEQRAAFLRGRRGDEADTAAAQRRQLIQTTLLTAAAAGATGGAPSAGQAILTGGFAIAGSAIGGPQGAQIGATIGSILGGLLFKRRQRPQLTEPIPVKVMNFDDMASSFLKVTQQALGRAAGGGIDRIEDLRAVQIQTGVA